MYMIAARFVVRVVHAHGVVQPRPPGLQPPRPELVDLVAALPRRHLDGLLPRVGAAESGRLGHHAREPAGLELDVLGEVVGAQEDHVAAALPPVHIAVPDDVRKPIVSAEVWHVRREQRLRLGERYAIAAVHHLEILASVREAGVRGAVVREAADDNYVYVDEAEAYHEEVRLSFEPDYDESGVDGFKMMADRVFEYDSHWQEIYDGVISKLKGLRLIPAPDMEREREYWPSEEEKAKQMELPGIMSENKIKVRIMRARK